MVPQLINNENLELNYKDLVFRKEIRTFVSEAFIKIIISILVKAIQIDLNMAHYITKQNFHFGSFRKI